MLCDTCGNLDENLWITCAQIGTIGLFHIVNTPVSHLGTGTLRSIDSKPPPELPGARLMGDALKNQSSKPKPSAVFVLFSHIGVAK